MCFGCCACVLVGQYEALAWLCGGLSFFAALGLAAVVNDKASKMPYVSAQFYRPFDFAIPNVTLQIDPCSAHLFGL